jgi:adenosine deaminase
MKNLVLRQLATDKRTMATYFKGIIPSAEEIISHLFLAEHDQCVGLPDHYIRNIVSLYFEKCVSATKLLTTTINTIVIDNIEWRGNQLYVQLDKLQEWQNIITSFPPLPLVSFAIFNKYGAPSTDIYQFRTYIAQNIIPNLGATAIPSPFHPTLRQLAECGLHELHQHLSGTTEADIVWLQALERPDETYENLRKGFCDKFVKEQYKLLEQDLTPWKLYNRLRLAAILRQMISDHIMGIYELSVDSFCFIARQAELPISQALANSKRRFHPLSEYMPAINKYDSIVLEGLFQVLVFSNLAREKNSVLANAYHLYLLIHGTFSQFMVQQLSQSGFDQFQRITINEFRSESEKQYASRFRQVAGNVGICPATIEGRFSPKKNVKDNMALIRQIVSGYANFSGKRGYDYSSSPLTKGKPQLQLIAHFIKKKDNERRRGIAIRHHLLRNDLERQARTLLTCRKVDNKFSDLFVGIDAASNELHVPPEVFAPIFRYFRRNGFFNFTYHVGEDFVHLLSGLRSIWEAVQFLDLRQGNRIGHATAIGISPQIWLKDVNNTIAINKLEWLDNLIFAYELLKNESDGQPYLERLRFNIDQLAMTIYGDSKCYSLSDLVDAWKMRDLNPLLACYSYRKVTDSICQGETEEWHKIEKAREMKSAFDIFCSYHLKEYNNEMIQVDASIIDNNAMNILQKIILKKLHQLGVVIETMPTSNVRISFYRDYSEHHIWRWLDTNNDERPTLCLCSDNPGIFATNLFNEYAHVFQGLRSYKGKSLDEATSIVEMLAKNGERYRFRLNE